MGELPHTCINIQLVTLFYMHSKEEWMQNLLYEKKIDWIKTIQVVLNLQIVYALVCILGE